MKKLALVIGCLVPLFSFAGSSDNQVALDNFQELCAKEQDPVKRQSYCHILDRHSQSQANIGSFTKETVIV